MADEEGAPRSGMVQSALDEFVSHVRSLGGLVGSMGSGALGAIPEPVPTAVTRMLTSLHQLIEQAPPLTAELDVVLQEIHAKRLTAQALQAELAAFDSQLDVLEKSLAPLKAWSHQWTRLQRSMTETLGSSASEPDSTAP